MKQGTRRTTWLLVAMVMVLSIAATKSASASAVDNQSCRLVKSVFAFDVDADNRLRNRLPSMFFSKATFDCTPCCNQSEQVYQSCLRRKDVEVCDCAALAYNTCLDGGCGPCNCCHNWYLFGYGYGCWTSAESVNERLSEFLELPKKKGSR